MTDDKQLEPEEPTPPAADPPAAPKRRWTRYLTPALALVAALVVGGLAGVLIGQNTAHGSPQRAGFIQGGGGFRGGPGPGQGAPDGGPNGGANRAPAGGGFTAGTITAIDGDTLTVKLPDGTTVKVTTSDSTKVTTTATSSVSKLKTGDKVTVIGRKDASGDLDAATIAEGQSGFGAFRGGAGGQGRDGTGSGD